MESTLPLSSVKEMSQRTFSSPKLFEMFSALISVSLLSSSSSLIIIHLMRYVAEEFGYHPVHHEEEDACDEDRHGGELP